MLKEIQGRTGGKRAGRGIAGTPGGSVWCFVGGIVRFKEVELYKKSYPSIAENLN